MHGRGNDPSRVSEVPRKTFTDNLFFRVAQETAVVHKIGELIDGVRTTLAVPVDSKITPPPPSNTNEKTQTSSTPYSPDEKQPELSLALPPALPEVKIKLQYERISEMVNPLGYVKFVP